MVEPSPATSESHAKQQGWTPAAFGFGRLFNLVPDAVIVGDATTGRIVLWNAASAAMFGYEIEEGSGLLIEDLVPPEMRAQHAEGIRRLARDEPTPLIDSESVVELQACRKDGTTLWVELRLSHVPGPGGGRFALAVIRDISVRREADVSAQAAVVELEAVRDELERRNRELDLVARTDHLTGLWNRRHVEESLAAAMSAARRHGRPLSVLLLDVDEFKSVNSRFGHAAGDRALQEVATRLREHIRAEDTLGRWGGEEFLVVLPDTARDVAYQAADRLRMAVGQTPIAVAGTDIAVTVSIGVAGGEPRSHDRLLRDADEALSRAKRAGRNRTST